MRNRRAKVLGHALEWALGKIEDTGWRIFKERSPLSAGVHRYPTRGDGMEKDRGHGMVRGAQA